ncbi:MAG: hypothetical protein PHD46_05640 [Eubacteriales bacterium]|nr:hypothetical protein [Eubacteriales bacterium]MDD4422499.1 hypothetical protein [Eubacteriales bacterium]HBR32437.1 hypothetical protein [Clostridiales bacterium]
MIRLKSSYSADQLAVQWDKRTSPERFAGNDDFMDLCFAGFRKGNRIKLARRNGISREPFSTVFRGKIVSQNGGSEIRGIFTKGLTDYITVFFVLAFVIAIYGVVKSRNAPMTAINVLLIITVLIAFVLLLTLGRTKREYLDFIKEIL